MIKRIKLRFGNIPDQGKLEFDLTPVTLFIGPNNSGKSKALKEIETIVKHGNLDYAESIIEELMLYPYTPEEAQREIALMEQPASQYDLVGDDICYLVPLLQQSGNQDGPNRIQFRRSGLIEDASSDSENGRSNTLLSFSTIRLDGSNRLNLLSDRKAGDLKAAPANLLTLLFKNDYLRKKIRKIIKVSFDKYFVIDPTNIGMLSVRFSAREPENESEEKSWEEKSIAFHSAALDLKQVSDGIKAFSGIITTLLAGDPKIALVDEPEAFLHPGLANKLGIEASNAVRDSKKRMIAATHSASFLMGCIQSGVPLNVVRLTYNGNVATACLLSESKILHLMRNPLLRSTGVLNGLFYDSVIVTESDSDRAFYQEINERLLTVDDPRGIPNCLFLNAQNKQTVWEIVKPLRELGIPSVGIVDIDVLKEGGQVFNKPLDGAFIPQISRKGLVINRAEILNAMEATKKNMKRDGGINILSDTDREAAQTFLHNFQQYGVFIVPGGELECWLQCLGIKGHGPAWLISIFEAMKEDPLDNGYLRPQLGDVWDFIGEIKLWLENPLRKGMPD